MQRDHWIAIVNPASGSHGRRSHRLQRIVERLRPLADKLVFTGHRGHAAELAGEARNHEGILVAGGDGTIFEVLQGMNRAKQRMAIAPAGRGNSLARDLTPVSQPIDLMEISLNVEAPASGRYVCASTVAVGYPVTVAEMANGRFRALDKYCYAAAAALTRPEPFRAQVALDGGAAREVRLTGFIANNTRYLANFLAFPHTSCRDGRLDILELRRGFFGQSLHNSFALAGRRYPLEPSRAATRARLCLDRPRTVLLDGELYPGVGSIEIRLLASAVACRLAA